MITFFISMKKNPHPRYLIKEPPDKQTVNAPLSEVNLLERSATYLARETARSSCSKTSMTTLLVPAIDAFSGAGRFLGLTLSPLNVRGREKKMWLEGG